MKIVDSINQVFIKGVSDVVELGIKLAKAVKNNSAFNKRLAMNMVCPFRDYNPLRFAFMVEIHDV